MTTPIKQFTLKYKDIHEATIFNLPEYRSGDSNFNSKCYNTFYTFYKSVNDKLDTEIINNTGNIINLFTVDGLTENEKIELESIKNEYYKMYIKPIDNGTYRYPIIEKPNKIKYPHFLKDLHNKSNIIYEKYEELLGLYKDKITGKPIRIEEQTNEQLLETLLLRINGLQDCQIYKTEFQENNEKHYYYDEYMREYEIYQKVINNSNLTPLQKIEEICKNIFYSYDSIDKYQKKKYDFNKIVELFKKNDGIEELYSRTFLPNSIFNFNEITKDYELNYNKLKELLDSGDRSNRQFIFGFYTDDFLKTVRELKPFLYEAGGMIHKKDYNDSCHLLVNWSIFLNMLYCRCGITNEIPLCPSRFVLPFNIIKPSSVKKENNEVIIEFNIRDKIPLLDLFDNNEDTNTKFLGIISIKYFHEETGDIRIWYLFIFKNNNLTLSTRQNTITGVRDNIILCNYQLRQINKYGLFSKHNITHYELLHYIYLSNLESTDTRKIYFYIPLGTNDKQTIFISKHSLLDSNPILDNLKLRNVNITMDNKYNDKHKIPETLIKLKYQDNIPIISGGSNNYNININTTTNENKLYFSNLVFSSYYTKFLKNLEINIYK